jgi:D-3-phosphoglycerate dehydrogenase
VLTPHARLITAADTEGATLRAAAAEAAGIIVRAKLPDDIVDHAPRLKGMVRHGVGIDFIPVKAATARGVAVANLPGSNTRAVAEYCMAALLSLRRPLLRMDQLMRSDGWPAARALSDGFAEIGGTVLGILGVGTIGSRVAEIARIGFGMKVLGTSRRRGVMPAGVEEVSLDDLFARSDAIVISCALTDETRGIVSARLIGRMQPHAVLINVSRGAVLDTAALVAALKADRIGGAALDVFDVQPLPRDSELLACQNVLLTPHSAALTASSSRAMAVGAAEEMLRILRGERPINLVNPDYRSA